MFLRLEPKPARRWFRPACKNHLNVRTILRLVEPEQQTELDFEPGLFDDFAVQAFMNVLMKCQVASRQVPVAGAIERGRRAPQQQDAVGFADNRAMHTNPEPRFDGSHTDRLNPTAASTISLHRLRDCHCASRGSRFSPVHIPPAESGKDSMQKTQFFKDARSDLTGPL